MMLMMMMLMIIIMVMTKITRWTIRELKKKGKRNTASHKGQDQESSVSDALLNHTWEALTLRLS